MSVNPAEKPWFHDLQQYLETGQFPDDTKRKERISLRMLSHQFISYNGMLYKRALTGVHLRCVDKDEAQELMEVVYEGVCGPHMNGTVLAKKIVHQGYFWLTKETDCVKFIKKCHNCQAYGDVRHLPSMKLQGMTSPWPFTVWGIDIIEEIRPKVSNGYRYIIVDIDYFSKWVEAESYVVVGSKQITRFIERNIICRYGLPHHVVIDNGV